jgi:hypothetical protein
MVGVQGMLIYKEQGEANLSSRAAYGFQRSRVRHKNDGPTVAAVAPKVNGLFVTIR